MEDAIKNFLESLGYNPFLVIAIMVFVKLFEKIWGKRKAIRKREAALAFANSLANAVASGNALSVEQLSRLKSGLIVKYRINDYELISTDVAISLMYEEILSQDKYTGEMRQTLFNNLSILDVIRNNDFRVRHPDSNLRLFFRDVCIDAGWLYLFYLFCFVCSCLYNNSMVSEQWSICSVFLFLFVLVIVSLVAMTIINGVIVCFKKVIAFL